MARPASLVRAFHQLRRRHPPRAPLALAAIAAALGLWALGRRSEQPPVPDSLSPGEHLVARVVDGDTLLLESGARVRLIGIDAPETKKEDHPVEPWGPEAAAFTAERVEGQRVRLEFDKERVDQHQRFLAYVYYRDPQTGTERLLNEELVAAGLTRAQLQYNNSATMERRLQKAEEKAKAGGLGIWSARRGAA